MIWVGCTATVLRQLRQCLVALQRRHGHPGLEFRPVIPYRALHRRVPLVRHHPEASVKQADHLSLSEFLGPSLMTGLTKSQFFPRIRVTETAYIPLRLTAIVAGLLPYGDALSARMRRRRTDRQRTISGAGRSHHVCHTGSGSRPLSL